MNIKAESLVEIYKTSSAQICVGKIVKKRSRCPDVLLAGTGVLVAVKVGAALPHIAMVADTIGALLVQGCGRK